MTDDLPNLELAKLANEPGTQQQANDERGETGGRRSEGDVLNDIQYRHLSVKWKEEVVEHQADSALRRSTTTSVRMPREPLTRTTSPDLTSVAARSAAAVLFST